MSRPLRLQYPGAMYYVTARGNARQALVRDDSDRQRFLATVAWRSTWRGSSTLRTNRRMTASTCSWAPTTTGVKDRVDMIREVIKLVQLIRAALPHQASG